MHISKILVTLADGQSFSLTLDPKNHAHQKLMTATESALNEKSFEHAGNDVKKFDALSERKIIANTALTKSGVVVGL
jgi:hypothetical protein